MFDLYSFYRSKEWVELLKQLKIERANDEGQIICEYCGKPIVRAYDIIGHHDVELTEDNVNDYEISLNKDNIKFVHHKCHNMIHNKLGYSYREVYLVYGAPMSGKRSWVDSVRNDGDLIIDIDSIWECVSGCKRYMKPNRLKSIVFKIRNELLESVKYRNGKWQNVYIIGSYPLVSERERLCKELGAREIFIESTRDECVQKLFSLDDEDFRKIDKANYLRYIDEWFERYIGPQPN